MTQLFKNNAVGSLAATLASGATSLTLGTGQGTYFPTPTGGDFFVATLIGLDSEGRENAWEIVKVTGRSTDALTIVRAQEGTTNATWPSGTRIELRTTAGTLESLTDAIEAAAAAPVQSVFGRTGNVTLGSSDVTGALGFTPENAANKGAANGYAPLGSDSKIASTYLPSYVDDVLEYANFAALPSVGEAGKIYVLLTPYTSGGITSSQFRWSGSAYAAIIASPGSTDAVTEGSVNLYFTNARAQSALSGMYLPIGGGTLTGNLALSGTRRLITGDFSNATASLRLAFQSSTTNGNTVVPAKPNGTGTASYFIAHNAADADNSAYTYVGVTASEALLRTDKSGTGSYLPLGVYAGGSRQAQFLASSGSVNYLTLSGGASGAAPALFAAGSDTDVSLILGTKGSANVLLWSNGNTALAAWNPASSVNALIVNGNITGYGPGISVTGSDTNIDLNITTKGTGKVIIGAPTTIQGLTVGKGGGAVATNTAVGVSALAANTSGTHSAAFGNQALYSNKTGVRGVAIGNGALFANTTGNYNVAVGDNALVNNTTASNNTAVGYQAGYSNTTGTGVAALGYLAGYGSTTASYSVAIGNQALQSNSTSNSNTAVGGFSLNLATGVNNTAIGYASGSAITTGSKNTILGSYNGNQGGLDIRTASNYVVLSDGDGNPRATWDSTGKLWNGGVPATDFTGPNTKAIFRNSSSDASNTAVSLGSTYNTGATSTFDTGIPINAGEGAMSGIFILSGNTGAGTATRHAVYLVSFYYSGNNTPTAIYIAGSSSFATFGKSAGNTLTIQDTSGAGINASWILNKV